MEPRENPDPIPHVCADNPDVRAELDSLQQRVEVYRTLYQHVATDLNWYVASAWAAVGALYDNEPEAWRYLVYDFPQPPDGHPYRHLWQHES